MLDRLPPQSPLLGDAGFVGYDFWNALAAAGVALGDRGG